LVWVHLRSGVRIDPRAFYFADPGQKQGVGSFSLLTSILSKAGLVCSGLVCGRVLLTAACETKGESLGV